VKLKLVVPIENFVKLTRVRSCRRLWGGKVHLAMQKIGISIAEKISQIAQNWGNKTAREWAKDLGFIQYLTIMSLNAYPHTC